MTFLYKSGLKTVPGKNPGFFNSTFFKYFDLNGNLEWQSSQFIHKLDNINRAITSWGMSEGR
jgi:hypothetical protein